MYNQPESDIYAMAEHMENVMKKAIEKSKTTTLGGKPRPAPEPSEDQKEIIPPAESNSYFHNHLQNQSVSFEEKVKMTEKVRKLKPEDLTAYVRAVQEMCPKAVNDVDEKKLQIKVDELDRPVFEKLMDMLSKKVGGDNEEKEPPMKKNKAK